MASRGPDAITEHLTSFEGVPFELASCLTNPRPALERVVGAAVRGVRPRRACVGAAHRTRERR
jgi:hypothetical protein